MTLKYEKALCTEPDCYGVRYGAGKICKTHYNRSLRARQRILVCKQDGCSELSHKHGLCKEHCPRCLYCDRHAAMESAKCRWHRSNPSWTDSNSSRIAKPMSNIEKMDKYVPRGLADDDCWPWLGLKNASGYGMVYDEDLRTTLLAHRFVWLMYEFDIPDGMHLDHLCRNTLCVNPQHLEVVTKGENTRRMTKYWSQFDECITEGCISQGVARGKCAKCYSASCPFFPRLFRITLTFEEYVERRIRKHEDGCWDWVGRINTSKNLALPQMYWDKKTRTAYREIFQRTNGVELTPEQNLDHLCRNRICVNPEHLEVVTHEENQRRRWEADRARIKQLEEGDEVA